MGKITRCLLVLLLSLSLCQGGYSEPSFAVDWDRLNGNLDSLEMNWNLLTSDMETLQRLLREQETRSAADQVRLANLERSLERSERRMRLWRICCIAAGVCAVTSTGLLAWSLNR